MSKRFGGLTKHTLGPVKAESACHVSVRAFSDAEPHASGERVSSAPARVLMPSPQPRASSQPSPAPEPLPEMPERSDVARVPAPLPMSGASGRGARSPHADGSRLSPTVTIQATSTDTAVAPLPSWTASEPDKAASPAAAPVASLSPRPAQSILAQLPISRGPHATPVASQEHTTLADLPITVASLAPPPPPLVGSSPTSSSLPAAPNAATQPPSFRVSFPNPTTGIDGAFLVKHSIL